jgi:hypothetical protein
MASRATADNPASTGASAKYSGRQLRKSSRTLASGSAANSLIRRLATTDFGGDFKDRFAQSFGVIEFRGTNGSELRDDPGLK